LHIFLTIRFQPIAYFLITFSPTLPGLHPKSGFTLALVFFQEHIESTGKKEYSVVLSAPETLEKAERH